MLARLFEQVYLVQINYKSGNSAEFIFDKFEIKDGGRYYEWALTDKNQKILSLNLEEIESVFKTKTYRRWQAWLLT
jgi:hypothetical protein